MAESHFGPSHGCVKHKDEKKLLAKLLRSGTGRLALKELTGIAIEPASEEQVKAQANLPLVAFLNPCYEKPEPEMANAYVEMIDFTKKSGLAKVFNGPTMRGSSVVHWTRNQLIAQLMLSKLPFTHVLFMDDDIVPPPDALVKLLSHGKDIIGAVCTKRKFPPIPNIRKLMGNGFQVIYSWPQPEGLLEVDGVGTGMMLISSWAIGRIAQAYFNCEYEKKYMGMSDGVAAQWMKRREEAVDDTADAFWFRFLPAMDGAGEYGEDMAFCLLAKQVCGIPIFCDTSIQPGHIGTHPYSVKDFLPYRDAMIAKAKKQGRYKSPNDEPQLTDEDVAETPASDIVLVTD